VINVVEIGAAQGEGAQRVESHAGRRVPRDVIVLRLIRQRHEAMSVLLGKLIKAPVNISMRIAFSKA
jgi:hypothetical protein